MQKDNRRRWLTINRREQWQEGFLKGTSVKDDSIVLTVEKGIASGSVYLPALDGGERDFDWTRLSIRATLPEDTILLVSCYASNTRELSGEEPDIDAYLKDTMVTQSNKTAALDALFQKTVRGATELLLMEKGRYLWLKLELLAAGGISPAIHELRLEISGDHMMEYMPAVYRREDKTGFLRRYLSIFNTLVTDLEERVYSVAEQFDYERTGRDMLRFLAKWVCVQDAGEDEQALRDEIAHAVERYRLLYTPGAIKEQVFRWTGHMPALIEHYQVKECLKRSADRDLYLRLYGENPYQFFLLIDENAFSSRQEADDMLTALKARIPAHVDVDLVLLKKNVYLDWHTYLGVNSIIGGYALATMDEKVALQYDTIIGGEYQ